MENQNQFISEQDKHPIFRLTSRHSCSIKSNKKPIEFNRLQSLNTVTIHPILKKPFQSMNFTPTLKKSQKIFKKMSTYVEPEYTHRGKHPSIRYKRDKKFSFSTKFDISQLNVMGREKQPSKTASIKEIIQTNENPLEIPEEDKIFNDYEKIELNNFNTIDGKNEVNGINLIKIKEKHTQLSARDKLFNDIYKITPELVLKIRTAKNSKRHFDLNGYQQHLVNTVGKSLSKESRNKLEKEFSKIRYMTERRYETNFEYIREIEHQEEKIINTINYEGDMWMNKTASSGFKRFKNYILPKIKFKKIIKDEESLEDIPKQKKKIKRL